jgi:antitoxin ParD1/3/4
MVKESLDERLFSSYDAKLHHNCIMECIEMTRASISITEPNAEWLQSQIDSKEFSSRSDVINDLIRKARQKENRIETLRSALIAGEESGVSRKTPDEIIQAVMDKITFV